MLPNVLCDIVLELVDIETDIAPHLPDLVGEFHVSKAYYKYGDTTNVGFKNLAQLMSAALRHEKELCDVQPNEDYRPAWAIPNCCVELEPLQIIAYYFGYLRRLSPTIMTEREHGYRWDAIFMGVRIA